MGYEDEVNRMSVQHYVPILSDTILVGLTLIFSKQILRNWRRTIICVIFYALVYVFFKFVHLNVLETHDITIAIFN